MATQKPKGKKQQWQLYHLQLFNSPNPTPHFHHPHVRPNSNRRLAPPRKTTPPPLQRHGAPRAGQEDKFENRLSKIRFKYRSGMGKKAEIRKARQGKKTGSGSSSGSSVLLPPVALKEPVSDGLKVEFGFSPYSERVNGRIAVLGLTALLLVELATGQGVIKYHSPSIVFVQVYFVAAVSALYVKFEKEKISVWPSSQN